MIHGFDARAVRAEKVPNAKLTQLVTGPVEFAVVEVEKVKPSDDSVCGGAPDSLTRMLERIDKILRIISPEAHVVLET